MSRMPPSPFLNPAVLHAAAPAPVAIQAAGPAAVYAPAHAGCTAAGRIPESSLKGGDHEALAAGCVEHTRAAGALDADIHELLFYAHKHAAAACFPRGFDVAAFEAAIAEVPMFLRDAG